MDSVALADMSAGYVVSQWHEHYTCPKWPRGTRGFTSVPVEHPSGSTSASGAHKHPSKPVRSLTTIE